ncbi:histidine decarboxylase [Actinoplanes sp. NPDC049316]|uniref:histidine decarboxylase n=1 Tax=Actinoplanes sp. NPDC049316 TaxID=3154727 RepID=UPI0034239BA5
MNARLRAVETRLAAAAPTNIGFPAARDIDYGPLAPLLGHLLNNLGDPRVDPLYPGHVHDLEREVLDFTAELFRAPPGWSGYLTSGGTEGNLYGLWLGRTKLPNAVAYYSSAAHYSVPKACHLLGLPAVEVATTATGQIDYTDLTRQAGRHRSRPAIVVATIGTTMTEAVDDVIHVHNALDVAGIRHRYVHSDAALAGVPLATTSNRPAFDLAEGADSISVSGHKFFGTPVVCGIVVTRRGPDELGPAVPYLDTHDTTISGSRNGLAAAMLWHAMDSLGEAGHTARARRARDVAAYAVQQLHNIGWPAWRNPLSFTVLLRQLPADMATTWPLPTQDGWSHIICMPGIETKHIDHLVETIAAHGGYPHE